MSINPINLNLTAQQSTKGVKKQAQKPKAPVMEFKGSVVRGTTPNMPASTQSMLDKIDEFIQQSKTSPLFQ
jgi:hypothetical protein